MKKKLLVTALLGGLGVVSQTLFAAPLINGDKLILTAGNAAGAAICTAGSCFGMEVAPGFIVYTNISGFNNLIIGTAQGASGTHTGAPNGSENSGIDTPWTFFGNTGLHFTSSPVNNSSSDSSSATLDFSGWAVTWNGIAAINMGSGGSAPVTCAGPCANGGTYSLNYAARVPVGDPSGFGGVAYDLHLRGTITFRPDTAPVAINDSDNALADAATPATIVINVLGNDTDVNADALDVSSVVKVTNPTNGTATVNTSTGTISYTPNAGFGVGAPAIDTFTYTVEEDLVAGRALTSNVATVTVNVSADPAPTANADEATANGTTAKLINLVANDTDVGGGTVDATSVLVVTNPTHGTVTNNANGTVTYQATAGFIGEDTFTYTVEDNTNNVSAAATVTVNVLAAATPAVLDPVGAVYVAGATAVSAGSSSGVVTAENIGVTDPGEELSNVQATGIVESCLGGCFDFSVSGVGVGGTLQMILPLSEALPEVPASGSLVYRKLIGSNWQNFDATNGNSIKSAEPVSTGPTVCSNDLSEYVDGLTPGHQCVLLAIVDGGANDADGLANGTVVDPSGVAETESVDNRTSGTGGAGALGLLSLLALFGIGLARRLK